MSLPQRLRKIANDHIDRYGRHPDSETMLEACAALEANASPSINIAGLKSSVKKEA